MSHRSHEVDWTMRIPIHLTERIWFYNVGSVSLLFRPSKASHVSVKASFLCTSIPRLKCPTLFLLHQLFCLLFLGSDDMAGLYR